MTLLRFEGIEELAAMLGSIETASPFITGFAFCIFAILFCQISMVIFDSCYYFLKFITESLYKFLKWTVRKFKKHLEEKG